MPSANGSSADKINTSLNIQLQKRARDAQDDLARRYKKPFTELERIRQAFDSEIGIGAVEDSRHLAPHYARAKRRYALGIPGPSECPEMKRRRTLIDAFVDRLTNPDRGSSTKNINIPDPAQASGSGELRKRKLSAANDQQQPIKRAKTADDQKPATELGTTEGEQQSAKKRTKSEDDDTPMKKRVRLEDPKPVPQKKEDNDIVPQKRPASKEDEMLPKKRTKSEEDNKPIGYFYTYGFCSQRLSDDPKV
ncbi:hypothetical protein F4810DRAFT_45224 [Camillea tinctor]|nr:hypothetical protein F4810DRAFT_45224 [Camillea tinctor]